MKSPTTKMTTGQELSDSPYRFVIGGLILLANMGLALNLFASAPLFPLIIEDYSINRSTVGLLITLALLVIACTGLPGGIIVSRMGVRRAFTAGWWLVGLMALSGVAPNFATLLVLRLAYGLGAALIVAASGPLIMRWFRPKETLVMNGLNMGVFSLGIALSVFTAAPLADAVGWANALSIFGAVGVTGAIAWAWLGRPVGDTNPPVPMLSRRELWGVLSSRAVILLVAADAGVFIQYTALTTWLPSFFNEVRGLSLTQAGFVTGLLPFVGVFAVLLGVFLPFRVGFKRIFFLAPGIMIVLGGPGAFLFDDLAWIYLSVLLLGIGSWLYQPMLMSMPMRLPGYTPEKVAIVWGSFMSFSGFGMFLAPLLVGGLRDISGSFLPGFIICAVAAWSLPLAGVFMPEVPLGGDKR